MSEIAAATSVVAPKTDYTKAAADYIAKMRSSGSGFLTSLDKFGWASFITVITLVITAIVNIGIAMNVDITDDNEKGKAEKGKADHLKNLSWVLLILSLLLAFFVIFVHLAKK